MFKINIPLSSVATSKTGPTTHQDMHGTTHENTHQTKEERIKALVDYCGIARSREEMQVYIGIANREHFRKAYLKPMLDSGMIVMTIPSNPKDKNQKYIKA